MTATRRGSSRDPVIRGMGMAARALVLLLLIVVGVTAQDRYDGPCGIPPRAKPRRIKGGEAFPPLPLPVTPLRRTERKRDPSPPVLMGKIQYGGEHTFTLNDGRAITYLDWNKDPNDLVRLLDEARRRLNIRYRSQSVDLTKFSFDPDETPILWVSGTEPPSFPPLIRGKLRAFLLAGGSLWADACRGAPAFTKGMREQIRRILPDRALRPLGPDHPVFSCVFDMKGRARYSPDAPETLGGAPYLEGVNIGCRTAVILSPYAMSCAWDSGHIREGCAQMLGESALPLGLNMVAYALAYRPLGRYLARPPRAAAETVEPGGFVFAQVRFEGEYDPDPGAFANLLKGLSRKTPVKVAPTHPFVALDDPELMKHPFIYMTGHGFFRLTPPQVEGLAAFLEGGGFLLADACCGDLEFHRSFHRALAEVLPEDELKAIPEDDPLFLSPHRIEKVEYTSRVRTAWPGLNRPVLEGIERDGAWCVVFSRFDLGCGWEGVSHPYAKGVASEDALKIGTNVILYALIH